MAEKKAVKVVKVGKKPLQLGDQVKIRHSAGLLGQIVELRGPLGPRGAQIYRVRVRRRPKPAYIELRGDQLALVSG